MVVNPMKHKGGPTWLGAVEMEISGQMGIAFEHRRLRTC